MFLKMFIKTQGIILTKKPFKEKSSIVYILTKNLGVTKVKIEGLRRSESKLLSILEPGTYGKIALVFDHNKLKFLTILPYKIPNKIFKKYPYTYLWALRLLTFFNFLEISQRFWNIIKHLDEIILKSQKSFYLWFIIKILDELGVRVNLTNCNKCGVKLKNEIYIKNNEFYCGKCKKVGYVKISKKEYEDILKFIDSDIPPENYPKILKSIIKSHLKNIRI